MNSRTMQTDKPLVLKAEIWPAFINRCLFELKQDGGQWTMIFVKDAQEELGDQGGIWHRGLAHSPRLEGFFDLAEEIVRAPTEDKRLILDGVSVSLRLGGKQKVKFRCPLHKSGIKAIMCFFIGELFNYKIFKVPPGLLVN